MKITTDTLGCEIRAEAGDRLSDCDADRVRELLRAHGWVYFAGFHPSVEEFESFSAQFGTCAPTRTVHYPPDGVALGFHAEDAYNPYRPDVLWFLCRYKGSDGGKPTGVVDGVRLLAELPEHWQQFCREHNMCFDRQWSAEMWQGAVGAGAREEIEELLATIEGLTYEFLEDDTLYVSYQAPLVVCTPNGDDSLSNTLLQAVSEPPFYGMSLDDGSPVPDELVTLVEQWALANEVELDWDSGDAVVIDNYRMMHRRGQYAKANDRDLRARHGETFFGTALPDDTTPVKAWAKRLLQGDEGYPTRVGSPHTVGAGSAG